MIPGTRGGSNWGGAAVDPASGILYVKSSDSPEIDLLQKVEPAEKVSTESTFFQGKAFYASYCSNCHGRDKRGVEPDYPSLIDLQNRFTKEEVLKKIKEGSGRMPSFAQLLPGKEEAIIAFLFELKDKKPSRVEADLFEIHSNRSSTNEMKKSDTIDVYLNITPYTHFSDIEGHPAIKPPWGELSAINLNTGEYEWKVTVGNHRNFRKKERRKQELKDMEDRSQQQEVLYLLEEPAIRNSGHLTRIPAHCYGRLRFPGLPMRLLVHIGVRVNNTSQFQFPELPKIRRVALSVLRYRS